MRVLLDTSYAMRGVSGSAVYIERLAPALRAEGVEVVEASQRLRLPTSGRNPLRSTVNALLDAVWLHGGLPRAARTARADVVHHPLPAHSRRIGVPQVVTVHDVAFLHMPGRYGPLWRRYARRLYRRAARRCGALVCPSRDTARDAEALLGAPRDRIVVAHHGPGQVEDGAGRRDPRHLLFAGGDAPRKNLPALLAAYASYREAAPEPLPLVLAGAATSAAGAPGVEARPNPSTAEMIELMRGAVALVHPSLHEGFGLTLLEAMALGVPVLAVRNAGTEELCGQAALLVEPGELAEGIARVAGDAALCDDLSTRGLERSRDFSWQHSARGHMRAYTLAATSR